MAGAKPKSSVVVRQIPRVNRSTRQSNASDFAAGISIGSLKARNRSSSHSAISTPNPAPATERTRLSVRSCRTSFQRGAPIANRMEISFRRSDARAKSIPAMLTQAISNTIPANAISTVANPVTDPRSAVPTSPGGERFIFIPMLNWLADSKLRATAFRSDSACWAVTPGFRRPSTHTFQVARFVSQLFPGSICGSIAIGTQNSAVSNFSVP